MPDPIVIFSTDWWGPDTLQTLLLNAKYNEHAHGRSQGKQYPLIIVKGSPSRELTGTSGVDGGQEATWPRIPELAALLSHPINTQSFFCLPNPSPTPIQIYLYLPFLFLGSDVSPYGVLTGTKCYCERPAFASVLGCWQQEDESSEYPEGP